MELVIIIGPIALGKSTLAAALADRLRGEGAAVAVVGLDTIAEMALPTLPDWDQAHEVHATVVRAWLATSVSTVIAEGPGSRVEVDQIMRQVDDDVTVFKVVLESSYDTAQRRVDGDATRGVSRDPAFLAEEYRRWRHEMPSILHDQRLDSEKSSPSVLAEEVVASMRAFRQGDPSLGSRSR